MHGCPHCKQSRLEHKISSILIDNKIDYIYQCNKKTLNWIGEQTLDFYLPKYKVAVAIECQGGGHFLPIKQFGGEEAFKKRIELDTKKRKLCEQNNVKLIYYTNIKKYVDNKKILDLDNIIKTIKEYAKIED